MVALVLAGTGSQLRFSDGVKVAADETLGVLEVKDGQDEVLASLPKQQVVLFTTSPRWIRVLSSTMLLPE